MFSPISIDGLVVINFEKPLILCVYSCCNYFKRFLKFRASYLAKISSRNKTCFTVFNKTDCMAEREHGCVLFELYNKSENL